MTKKELGKLTAAELEKLYPDAVCSLEHEGEPWKLLIMARLSAQCTDARVNIVSKELFKKYPTLQSVAECDLSGMLASGIGTISEGGMRKTAERVAREAESRSCKKIIVGLPKNMDGTEGESALAARDFAGKLSEATGLEHVMWDERCTTITAHGYMNDTNTRGKKRKAVIDKVAAVVILQSFIDSRR